MRERKVRLRTRTLVMLKWALTQLTGYRTFILGGTPNEHF